MKRITVIFCAGIVLSMFCTACQSKELPDTYVEGSDYQYMQMPRSGWQFTLTRAQGSKGMYILHGNYIYFIDEESNQILPLCNKADCLHDKETDSEKFAYCNACLLPLNGRKTGEMGISYCNGYLYCLDGGYADQVATLYRIAEDGSKKEEIYKCENGHVNEWVIHRNVLYYTKQFYEEIDGKIRQTYQVLSLPLSDMAKQEKTIFTADENLDVATLGKPSAYGNYVYFQILAYLPAEEELTDDNYLQYLYYKTFVYDIVNDQLSEIRVPDMCPTECISDVGFWDDKLLIGTFDLAPNKVTVADYYIAELDGTDPEIFMRGLPKNDMLLSDGEYLYRTNANTTTARENIFYEVYNQDLEQIDHFKASTLFTFSGIMPLSTDTMYLQYDSGDENDPSWGVIRWDKQIGTYHGEPIDKDIVDIPR